MLHTQPSVAEQFVSDVKREVAIIMKNPKEKTTGMVSFLFFLDIPFTYHFTHKFGLTIKGQNLTTLSQSTILF